MKYQFVNFAIGFLFNFVKSYATNSSSKVDDKILELTKIGAKYLANKTNNTITHMISAELNNASMKLTQSSSL